MMTKSTVAALIIAASLSGACGPRLSTNATVAVQGPQPQPQISVSAEAPMPNRSGLAPEIAGVVSPGGASLDRLVPSPALDLLALPGADIGVDESVAGSPAVSAADVSPGTRNVHGV